MASYEIEYVPAFRLTVSANQRRVERNGYQQAKQLDVDVCIIVHLAKQLPLLTGHLQAPSTIGMRRWILSFPLRRIGMYTLNSGAPTL